MAATTSATSEPLDAASELARATNGLAATCRLGTPTGMAATAGGLAVVAIIALVPRSCASAPNGSRSQAFAETGACTNSDYNEPWRGYSSGSPPPNG